MARDAPAGGRASGARAGGVSRVGRAVLVFCVLGAAGLWVLILGQIRFEHDTALGAARTASGAIAFAVEQQVVRTLRDARQIAEVARYEFHRSGTPGDVQRMIQHLSVPGEEPETVLLIDAAGKLVAGNRPGAEAIDFTARDFFRAQRDGREDSLYINQPVRGEISGAWQIPMSLALRDAAGRFQGVVVVSMTPEQLIAGTRGFDVGEHGSITVVGRDGIVRARRVGQVASQGQDISRRPPFQAADGLASGSIMAKGPLDGRMRLFSHRSLKTYPLIVLVGTDYDAVMGGFARQRTGYLVLATLASVFILGFGAVIWLALARQARTAVLLLEREALLRATFDHAALGLARLAPDGVLLELNPRLRRMLGRTRDELLGRRLSDFAAPVQDETPTTEPATLLAQASTGFAPEAERRYRTRAGTDLWLHEAYGAVYVQESLAYVVVALQDVTARRQLEHRMAHAAQHDALTSLPNPGLLRDRLQQSLARAGRRNVSVGVLYVDLDGFKSVNDSLGHAAGDQLLCEVARRLEACVRAEDTVGRLGGDEFALVLSDVPGLAVCLEVANKVIESVSQPVRIDTHEGKVGASVGIAVSAGGEADADTLLRRADEAMYAAKRGGRGCYVVAADPATAGTAASTCVPAPEVAVRREPDTERL